MYYRWSNKLFNTVQIHQARSEEIDNTLRKCYLKILCAWLYNNGLRQCIYVFTHELFAHETWYQNKNTGYLQSLIVTGRTWN